ncbi:unnamed protein product [Orchesella dallaii]|uniref:FHA domain-containing protein n=1 Tax=Orchesella dallaii TaxID=48710 RepID=A0ABP1RYH1_9HEXA
MTSGPLLYYIQKSSSEQGQDGQVVLCKSRYVSKMHCLIFMKDDKYWIEDLVSTNGTYLNGVHISCYSPRELYYGDQIGIGVDSDDMNVDFSSEQYFVFKFLKQAEKVVTAVDENDVTIIKEYRRSTCPSCGHKFTEKDNN